MQTNGTLLNEQYIKFLKEYDIHVGISLDRFSEEENKNRVYRNGKQTYSKVIENICRMQKNDNRFGIIITLSKNHIGKEKQIYDFIASNNINCNIRPAFVTKDNESVKVDALLVHIIKMEIF